MLGHGTIESLYHTVGSVGMMDDTGRCGRSYRYVAMVGSCGCCLDFFEVVQSGRSAGRFWSSELELVTRAV
jgi:hypothetical protein